ncbi:MAG: hypothetical protein A3G87_04380 [Omnitrophica bacterium RIFCSPLOWO2_12_FULL_50_11]|nr:MAG: hypothetical protein A3G87_04380 [Omnitrophica bacterium RIFCSPLOWO2_12_FULL_50_11]
MIPPPVFGPEGQSRPKAGYTGGGMIPSPFFEGEKERMRGFHRSIALKTLTLSLSLKKGRGDIALRQKRST